LSEKRNNKNKTPGKESAASGHSGPMDVRLLEQLVKLMASNDLNTVDVRDGDKRVILKRGPAGAPVQMFTAPSNAVHSPPSGPTASAVSSPGAAPAPSDEESQYHRITSPMVGTFYAAPKPGEKPFVGVGSSVTEDSDVCIIEAMKTFNNIKAECRGTVARVLVADGQPVEFGTVLFLVKPS